MYLVVKKLVDFGMDFQYENYGSQGEKVISFESSIEVVSQNGKIHFKYCGERKTINDSDESFEYIASLVEEALIEETT